MSNSGQQQSKINIVLKPEYLENVRVSASTKTSKSKRVNIINKSDTKLVLPQLGATNSKFNQKLRNIFDTLTFSVQDYIIYNLDNEATSEAYKTSLKTGLAKIRDDFITSRQLISSVNK